jgi:hypothetical protein
MHEHFALTMILRSIFTGIFQVQNLQSEKYSSVESLDVRKTVNHGSFRFRRRSP